MSTFDAPTRETCSLRRERTNTPLQALLMLNDPQYFEAAMHLAERVMKKGGTTADSRVSFLIRTCTSRLPKKEMLNELRELFQYQLEVYKKDTKAAGELISVGALKPDSTLDRGELAAWTMVVNIVLNMDEVLTKN